jgi:hypothetical protein
VGKSKRKDFFGISGYRWAADITMVVRLKKLNVHGTNLAHVMGNLLFIMNTDLGL